MTPAQFKQARHTLGLTIAETAQIMAVDPRTVRGWEAPAGSRSRDPSPTACRVMEWMLAGYRPPEWPHQKKVRQPSTASADFPDATLPNESQERKI